MVRDQVAEVEPGRGPRRPRKPSTDAVFRAAMEERLKGLEAQIAEMRTRLNGLLFFIAGTVIAQVVLRLVA